MKNNLAYIADNHLGPKQVFGLVLFSFGLIIFLVTLFFQSGLKIVGNSNSTDIPLSEPIEITFDKAIDRDSAFPEIEPAVAGSWSFTEKRFLDLHLAYKMTFTPESFLAPDTEYKIYLPNAKNVFSFGRTSNLEITFKTQGIPAIESISYPDSQDAVKICQPITVRLSEPNNGLADFDFSLTPDNRLDAVISSDFRSYMLIPNPCLAPKGDYGLLIDRTILMNGEEFHEIPETVFEERFTTETSPFIADYSPKGSSISTDITEVSIRFAKPVLRGEIADRISLKPNLKGSWSWINDENLIYTLKEPFKKDTLYTIEILSGAHFQTGEILDKNITMNFKTTGAVSVTRIFPRNGSHNVDPSSAVSVEFNQPVDHRDAESKFSLNPAVQGSFKWHNNTMTFKPIRLGKNETYEITLLSGIKSLFGLTSEKEYKTSFSTETDKKDLNIPIDYQDKALSCEAASLKMALTAKGIYVSEKDIMNIIGYDTTPHRGNVWGNPHKAFVGYINGAQNKSGYGVYWEPVARAGSNWRKSETFANGTAAKLAKEISDGNPVIIWGTIGNAVKATWHTNDGIVINAWKGEHTRVVTGFRGSIDDPTAFYLNDPIAGKLIWTKEQLLQNWSAFDNSGVVIY